MDSHSPHHQTHLSGLDGLRALAAGLVLAFHSNLPHTPSGGFLGVDLFFVISGFLITILLLREWHTHRDIALGQFYLRRLRRLYPVVLSAIVVCSLAAITIAPDALESLQHDVWYALTYTTNVAEILHQRSYFEQSGREPLLQHLWSLAIEEQFYLLWPMFLWWGLRHGALVGLRYTALVLALISTCQLIHLSLAHGYPLEADATRVYFGSDTHTMGLMVGAWLALTLFTPTGLRHTRRPLPRLANAVGLMALAGLLWCCFELNPVSEFLYLGGFLTVSVLAAIVVMMVVHPASVLSRILELKPFRWIGERSYGLYVWHWPVFALLRPELDVSWNPILTHLARFTITLALTECSHQWLEKPIRARRFVNVAATFNAPLRRPAGPHTEWTQRGLIVATALLVTTILSVSALMATPIPRQPPPTLAPPSVTVVEPTPTPLPPSSVADPTPSAVWMVGDSVLLGASVYLKQAYPSVQVDAEVGRQAAAVLALVKLRKAQGSLPPLVVVHLGTNGYFTETQLRDLLALLKDQAVVLINAAAPRRWVDDNNALLQKVLSDYPTVHLMDWQSLSKDHPEYFVSDHIHLTAPGIRAYASALSPWLGPPTVALKGVANRAQAASSASTADPTAVDPNTIRDKLADPPQGDCTNPGSCP